MLGDPARCRLYAARCLELSKSAKNPARRQNLLALAETWTKLAAEYEADQPLLNTLSEINFDEPVLRGVLPFIFPFPGGPSFFLTRTSLRLTIAQLSARLYRQAAWA